jgi:hypothetical protein
MHHKGYDIIYAEPGTLGEVRCQVCGAACDERRGVPASAGFAESISGSKRIRDVFTCPHAATEWHVLALKLVQEIERTPSKRIAELMRLDLRDLLSEHVPDDAPHAPEWLG